MKKKKTFRATAGIKLEPHKTFKAAIVGVTREGWYKYSYFKLVRIYEAMGMNYEEACEFVDYNVVGLEPNGLKVVSR